MRFGVLRGTVTEDRAGTGMDDTNGVGAGAAVEAADTEADAEDEAIDAVEGVLALDDEAAR